MIHDPALCKLGKRSAVHPKGMRMMASLAAKLPAAPAHSAWYLGGRAYDGRALAPITDWPMDGNDEYGDCVFAGAAHFEQLVSNAIGAPNVPTQAQVLAEYSKLTGFNPNDPSTDNGAVISDTLTTWKTNGLFGKNLINFIGANPKSQSQISDAIWFFGGATLGVELPISAQDQDVWDVPAGGPVGDGAPGSWGGHDVLLVNRDDRGVTLITWGATKIATWDWLSTYCDEAYAILSQDWLDAKGNTPGGVPLASMIADLDRISVS
jgi:hypothetical protein